MRHCSRNEQVEGCDLNFPVNILIVDHASIVGGTEMSLEALVTSAPHTLCHYTVAMPGFGPIVARLRKQGVSVELLRMEGWRWWVEDLRQHLKFVLTLPLQAISVMRWMRLIRRVKPDLIHFNINRLVEPVIAAWLLRIPSVMHYRDIPSRMSHRFVLGWSGFYALMNLADHWIANSKATERDIRPYARCPITTIPNGIDLEQFDQAARSDAADFSWNGYFVVAMIALLVPWKNHAGYLQLASQVCKRRSDVCFIVVGDGDSTYVSQLKQMACELGIEQKVNFLGQVGNVPALLKQVDMLVHSMPYESFGRVFVEAMAARKPVVAFNSGGAAEIVVNGETGILVPSDDIDAMADAVCRLLDNPESRKRMGEAGRRRVETSYTLQRHVGMVLDLYDRILFHEKEENPK